MKVGHVTYSSDFFINGNDIPLGSEAHAKQRALESEAVARAGKLLATERERDALSAEKTRWEEKYRAQEVYIYLCVCTQ